MIIMSQTLTRLNPVPPNGKIGNCGTLRPRIISVPPS